MRVIEVIIKTRWNDKKENFQETNLELENIVKTLMTHNLETLKKLFYYLLYQNVPVDMLTDRGYVKVNLCHVLAYYVNQVMQHEIIRIEEKFIRCKFCNEYFYFNSYKKDVCESCYVKNFQDDIKQRRLKQW